MATRRTWGKKIVEPPEGEIRRSQVVSTYGAGSMVDLVDSAVLIGGLNFWSYDRTKPLTIIHEPRLRDALAERFQEAGRTLSFENAFREPPIGDGREPTRFSGIQALEFPRWFVCQEESCRALVRADQLERKANRYRHQCTREKSAECVPVRFVVACKRGHLEDFPWVWFAHRSRQSTRCGAPSLRLREGASGDFSEIVVECTSCGAQERLTSFLVEETAPGCLGKRPWLGDHADDPCNERARLLVRTASNAYFPQVVSALSIPEVGRVLENVVREHWKILEAANEATLPAFRQIKEVGIALQSFGDKDVLAVVHTIKKGAPTAREPIRTAEFRQLVAAPKEKVGDLPPKHEEFFAREARLAEKPHGVTQVVLVHKLREVRAQIGFTRLDATTPDLQGEFDLAVESAALGLDTDWLPATEVRGEGVFLRFDEHALAEWEARPAVKKRAAQLAAGHADSVRGLDPKPPFLGVRFYFLHSLAHLLVTAISLECGYSASAIRERIFCSTGSDLPMGAILLSTGTTGSEGTLGGLVDQGRRIVHHLRRAFEIGELCSNDPVCADHSPHDDPTERFLEGAACHGCLYIAETSCERFNRYLDRALVVPAIGHPEGLAFFGEKP